eukprot:TRINITY_DN327_c0_g3_i1.p1 TRINITY_DN327_c0_g3~~TRINITY_DN327_c0_g3_i1.p1  ORF type:complete len:660 (-),score=337.64 TRINITY_DN327_c0_g3_i1:1671-3650(-)
MAYPAENIQFIVSAFNQEPFRKSFTMVSFDKIEGQALTQLLQDVLQEISEFQRVSLMEESPDQTAQRMFDFFWVLKYKIADPFVFKTGVEKGDKGVIYPSLFWCLQRVTELRKRAYLARFLLPMDVPPELTADDVYLEYKEKQAEFKEVHKTAEKIRSSGFQPDQMKQEYQALIEKKEQLNEKLERVKKKVEKVVDLEALLAGASMLRKEQEKEAKNQENLSEIHTKLHQAEQRLQRANDKVKDLQQFSLRGGIDAEMTRIEEELKQNRFLLDKLPQEVNEKKQWVDKLRKVLAEPALSGAEVTKIQGQITALRSEVKRLTTKRDASLNAVDDKLAFYRQQFKAVEKKKQDKEQGLKELQIERRDLDKDLARREEEEEVNPTKVLKGEELDKFVQELRAKTVVYKKYKQEQSEQQTEFGTLSRTLEILTAQHTKLTNRLSEIERERGVQHYGDTIKKIEDISAAKADSDAEKGKLLEEISKVVTEINQAIKERKVKLAPQIKDLRTTRQKYQELEVEYTEKKLLYDNASQGLQNEKERVEQERQAYMDEVSREESRYHFLHATSLLLDVNLLKASTEKEKGVETFLEKYQKAAYEQEQLGKTLREQQKKIKDTFEPNQAQINMFNDLKALLRLKLKLYSTGNHTVGGALKSDEPDRLVL